MHSMLVRLLQICVSRLFSCTYLDRIAAFTSGDTNDLGTFHTERCYDQGVDDTEDAVRKRAAILPILETIDFVANELDVSIQTRNAKPDAYNQDTQ